MWKGLATTWSCTASEWPGRAAWTMNAWLYDGFRLYERSVAFELGMSSMMFSLISCNEYHWKKRLRYQDQLVSVIPKSRNKVPHPILHVPNQDGASRQTSPNLAKPPSPTPTPHHSHGPRRLQSALHAGAHASRAGGPRGVRAPGREHEKGDSLPLQSRLYWRCKIGT